MGSKILYYLLIWPVSRLPFFVLYGLSDFLFVVMYYFAGYRKKLVFKNLKNAFPDKSEKEITSIARAFYRHFCDLIVEALKGFSISEKSARERMSCDDVSIIEHYAKQGRNVLLVAGHYNNWELYANAGALHLPVKLIGIYKKLRDPFMNKQVQLSRGKYGCVLVSSRETVTAFENYGSPVAIAFGMDQAPVSSSKSYWMTFLNQDTAVLFGTERYAKKYDTPVIYGHISKVKRGYYDVKYTLLFDKPTETAHGEITEKMTRFLEEKIREKPEFWLWTHKRWKRRRDDGT
jgi:KDO2-lipid IV(A) lauroyltransferase